MKKAITLALALLFTLALFAGCGGKPEPSTPTATPAGDGTTPPTGQVEDDSPYRYAVGNYETDEEGWPLEKYVYELPITTSDEVLTQMTLNFTPQYLPEDGYLGIPTYAGAVEMTGVNIEFNVIASSTYSTTLSVQEASEDLDDIIAGFWAYHSGSTLTRCIEDEQIANIHDYREYMPNYCWEIKSRSENKSLMSYVNMPAEDAWIGFCDFYSRPISATGYFIRDDWMEKLGLGSAKELATLDQFHDVLTAFKTNGLCDRPLILFSNIDGQPYNWNAFNTSPYSGAPTYRRVVDGRVELNGTTQDDLELMQMLNSWYNEGLIDPNFGSYDSTDSMRQPLTNDWVGTAVFNPSEVAGWEQSSISPECRWEPFTRLRKDTNQVIHWNLDRDEYGGCGSSIAASCENIPLACTYVDWCYSDYGADWMNWGPEGYGWEYTEDGGREWNEFILNNEMGVGWAVMCYFFNPMDAGINDWTRSYSYPGGQRYLEMFSVWDYATDNFYDGAYNYPPDIHISDEDSAEILDIRGDLDTYFTENYVMFLTGDKPFSTWDSFQAELSHIGLDRILEIYQDNYDAYMAA